MKLIGTVLILVSVTGFAMASAVPVAPEIDPGSAATAVTLLGGAILVIRSRKRK